MEVLDLVALVPSLIRMLHFQLGWDKFGKSVLICISPILNDSIASRPPNYFGLEFENPQVMVYYCTEGIDLSSSKTARQTLGTEAPRQSPLKSAASSVFSNVSYNYDHFPSRP